MANQGPGLSALNADVQSKAHLWLEGDDRAKALQLDPIVMTLNGPLQGGSGDFAR